MNSLLLVSINDVKVCALEEMLEMAGAAVDGILMTCEQLQVD